MAEVVLRSALEDARLDDRVEVVSSGTGDWHVGKPMDSANLREIGPGPEGRVLLFRDLDPRADGDVDVPDPYYGDDDGFGHVLGMVRRTSAEIVRQLLGTMGN